MRSRIGGLSKITAETLLSSEVKAAVSTSNSSFNFKMHEEKNKKASTKTSE
jgi:hypothetical protein